MYKNFTGFIKIIEYYILFDKNKSVDNYTNQSLSLSSICEGHVTNTVLDGFGKSYFWDTHYFNNNPVLFIGYFQPNQIYIHFNNV